MFAGEVTLDHIARNDVVQIEASRDRFAVLSVS